MEMFDEVVKTVVKPNGEVEAEFVSPTAEEAENAVSNFVVFERVFRKVDTFTADRSANDKWWGALHDLAQAESKLRDVFCGRDRSLQGMEQYRKWRCGLIEGKPCRADA